MPTYVAVYLTENNGYKSRKTMTVKAKSEKEARDLVAEELYLTDVWQIVRVNEIWEG